MLISVTGSARRAAPAERGTLHIAVTLESRTRDNVFQEVSEIHAELREDAKQLQSEGDVTWWSANQVRVSSRQRYLKDSDVTETYFVASGDLQVKFKDFKSLGEWVQDISSRQGVSVQGVRWTLTEKKHKELEGWVREHAVKDAFSRAEAYASAAGFGHVELAGLYEPGLRPTGNGGGVGDMSFGAPMATRAGMAKGSAAAAYELKPEDIEVYASITADFQAHRG